MVKHIRDQMREILEILEQNYKMSQQQAAEQASMTPDEPSKVEETKGNPYHTKNLLTAQHKLLSYVLTKLSISELQMIKGEQVGLADMLEDFEIGFYSI